MSTLLVVNGAPYGSEAPYNAFRLAEAVARCRAHLSF